jgi:hypothetical protein
MIEVYIFVSGGVVQGVRATEEVKIHVVDYDNNNEGQLRDEEFERQECGKSYAEVRTLTKAVF